MKKNNFFFLMTLASLLEIANPVWSQTQASLGLQFSNGYAYLSISGTVSNACTVQYTTNLTQQNPWHYQIDFQLTNSPTFFLDTNQSTSSAYFYRVFTQQLPTNVVPVSN